MEPDATCVPLIAAPYPKDLSGHLCLDGAHTRIARMYFGDTVEGGHSITTVSAFLQPGDAAVRHFDNFSQVLDGILEAPIWAGLHFRTSDLQGKTRGRSVVRYAAAHYLPAPPPPSQSETAAPLSASGGRTGEAA